MKYLQGLAAILSNECAEEYQVIFPGQKLPYFFFIIYAEKQKVKYEDKPFEETSSSFFLPECHILKWTLNHIHINWILLWKVQKYSRWTFAMCLVLDVIILNVQY